MNLLEQTMPITLVVFRRWKDYGTIIALFPEGPADLYGRYCDAYEHVGQHGSADYYGVIQASRPASVEESIALASELTRIGYSLRPLYRATWCHHQRRMEVARKYRLATG